MKNFLILSAIIFFNFINAQVGIGTTDPKSTLDVVGLPSNLSEMDGIIAPRLTGNQLNNKTYTADQTGAIVYVTASRTDVDNGQCLDVSSIGYYYFDGSSWNLFNSGKFNGIDVGSVLAWTNSTPPDYLLALSGGTYNWADYPDLQSLHNSTPISFISASNSSTFTLVNINSDGRFLRGGNTAGISQSYSTALPANNFTTNSTGNHTHSVDPASVSTSTTGSHTHTHNASGTTGNFGLIRRSTAGQNATATAFDTGGSGNEPDLITTVSALTINNSGDHSHTVDIPSTTSSSDGSHSHTINGGGDTETRPINISVIWCLKAKPTSTTGNVTINQISGTGFNGLTSVGNNIKLGGSLTEPTIISSLSATNKLSFTGSGVDAFNIDGTTLSIDATNDRVGIGSNNPQRKLEVNSGSLASPPLRFTQQTANNNATNTSGNSNILVVDSSGDVKTMLYNKELSPNTCSCTGSLPYTLPANFTFFGQYDSNWSGNGAGNTTSADLILPTVTNALAAGHKYGSIVVVYRGSSYNVVVGTTNTDLSSNTLIANGESLIFVLTPTKWKRINNF